MRRLFRPELWVIALIVYVGLSALEEKERVKPHDPKGCWACRRLTELNQPLPTNEAF